MFKKLGNILITAVLACTLSMNSFAAEAEAQTEAEVESSSQSKESEYTVHTPTKADILGFRVANKIEGEDNPYDLPLYDNLTLDADALNISYFEQKASDYEMLNYSCTPGNYCYTQEARGFFTPRYSAYWVAYSPYAESGSETPITLVDGRLLVAVAPKLMMKDGQDLTYRQATSKGYSGLSKNGTYFDVVFEDGTVLACMVGDTKGDDGDLASYDYWGHRAGNKVNLIEIIQWTPEEAGSNLPLNSSGRAQAYQYAIEMTKNNNLPSNGKWGADFSSIIGVNKAIEKFVIYDADHYDSTEGGGNYTSWTEKQEELSVHL